MKTSLMVVCLLFVGCSRQPESSRGSASNDLNVPIPPTPYVVLTHRPDSLLDAMASKYAGDDWRGRWTEDAALLPIDGQRTIHLLETACYADVQCHRVEYPLRIATLNYIRNHLEAPGVREALQWIRASYKSDLPLEEPDDASGQLNGFLVRAMKVRMTEYADDLLNH